MDSKLLITSKLPGIESSIFSTMSALARQENALNMGQGFPGFDCDDLLKQLVTKYMAAGHNQYAPMAGVLALREAIAKKIESLYDCQCDPEQEVTITAGATQAIFTAILALIRTDDEVIVFEPAYDSYVPAIKMAGGKAIPILLEEPQFRIDWEAVKNRINQRTRMIILNSPHNPTGKILAESDLEELKKLVADKDIFILSDEVYEHIVFDDKKHNSLLNSKELMEKTLAIFSFGKVYNNTGWKLGYVAGPPNLMKEFRKVHQFNVFSVNTPMQYAVAEYLADSSTYANLSSQYQSKRDFLTSALSESRFTVHAAEGSYFQLLSFEKINELADLAFAIELTKEKKLTLIPLSPFYSVNRSTQFLRICFAKPEEELSRAAEILCKI